MIRPFCFDSCVNRVLVPWTVLTRRYVLSPAVFPVQYHTVPVTHVHSPVSPVYPEHSSY